MPTKNHSPESSLAKISRPRLSAIAPRQRLFDLLDAASMQPVIWIMGPPGCGKTSLVSSYLTHRKLRGLWYELDDGDTDLRAFFRYLELAANKLTPSSAQAVAPDAAAQCATRAYFENLFARLPLPFVLVFDNYHEMPADSPLHEVLRAAFTQIPAGGNVVVMSRSGPPPSLARLHANQAIRVMGWQELRLTQEESNSIAHAVDGLKLTTEDAHALYEKTGGWAAGMVLLLDSLRETKSTLQTSAQQLHAGVFNYFAGEIFNRAAAGTRDLLMRTAFLPQVTASMAAQLGCVPDAGRLLAMLNRQQCFIEECAATEPAYRYHPLFREFLTTQAKQHFPPQVLAELKRHAARMLEEADQFVEAAELFAKVGDAGQIVRLILTHAPALVAQGRSRTLENCLDKLPQTLIGHTPWLAYWFGMCRASSGFAQGFSYFEQAFDQFRGQHDVAGMFLAWSGAVDSIWYEQDDFAKLDDWIAWLDERMQVDPGFPSADIEIITRCSMAGALRLRQPQRSDVSAWMERALLLAERVTDLNLHLKTRFNGAYYFLWRGDFVHAKAVIGGLQGLPKNSGNVPWLMLKAISAEAFFHWFTGAAEISLQTVGAGLDLARSSAIHTQDLKLYAIGIYAALTQDDPATAGGYLHTMLLGLSNANRMDKCHYHYLAGWFELLHGNPAAARAHAETSVQLAREVGVPFLEVLCRLALAQTHISHAGRAAAEFQLVETHTLVQTIKGLYPYLEYLWCLTRAQLDLDRPDQDQAGQQQCLEPLGKALILGREKNFFTTLWLPPSALSRLAQAALEAGIELTYVQKLIRKCRLMPQQAELECESWPWQVKIFTLGRFNVEKGGDALRFNRKAQQRPLDLLKALIALGGRAVGEHQLADALWPEADGDSAHRAFATTLHRLRKLLGNEKAITLHEGRVTLESRYCWVSNWAFERLLGKAESASNPLLTEKALRLYQGAFLRDDTVQPWATALRERLRSKFHRHVMDLGAELEQAGQWEKAIAIYHKALDAEDGVAEEFCQRLMLCYQRLNRTTEAAAIYHNCCKLLSSRGIKPALQTHSIYRAS